MEYFRSFRFVFEGANWLVNLLVGTLFMCVIPIIGPIVWLGYEFEVVEDLHFSRGQRCRDFAFDRFVPYLTRGVWPFLIQLIGTLPMVFFFFLLYIAGFVIGIAFGEKQISGMAALLLIVGLIVLAMAINFFISLLMMPLALRAGLAQEFDFGAAWSFMRDFHRRVFKELVLSQLFMTVMGPLCAAAGALLFCVGVYPAMTVMVMANFHLMYQLYELYLQRGGVEVPLKVETVQ